MILTPIPEPLLTRLRLAANRLDLGPGTGTRMTEVEATKAAFHDCLLALRWLFAKAAEVDPDGVAFDWFRLVIVGPSQQIPAHQDQPLPAGVYRHHLVLWTNDRAWTFYAGEWFRALEGSVYPMDPSQWHGAVNWGREPRVHLLVDVKGVGDGTHQS